ncbi:unnamed protein product [Urochloa humidicola]
MPGLDLNQPINWDEIGEFEGGVHDLTYDDYVWDSGNEAADEDEDEGDGNTTADGEDAGDEADAGAPFVQQAQRAPSVQQPDAGDEADGVPFDSGTPANVKRRRYYPPDIKRILYAMCLERSAPGMLKKGVTQSVARDMGVPLRVVQRVCEMEKLVVEFQLLIPIRKKIVALKNFLSTQMSSKMCHLDSVILSMT